MKNLIMSQTSVNVASLCIKHTAWSFWQHSIKACHLQIRNIIKLNNASSMVQSRIQPTTHGNKKNIGGGGWGWTKFEKGG